MTNKIYQCLSNKPKVKRLKQAFCINEHNSLLFAYKNHAYHVYKPKLKGLKKSIVNAIISDYEVMLSFYSRVLVCRIDLHPGQCSADNQLINQYLKKLTHLLTKHYDCKVLYHCAREQNTSEVEHYHVELMLSGHKINHSEKLLLLAKSMWEQHSKGTVSFVDNPFCIVLRGDKSSLKEAIYRSSYLAKEHTKELNGRAQGFLKNKLTPIKNFEPETDLMLVDPSITFEKNRRKQVFKMARKTNPNSIAKKSSKYGWFLTPTLTQQLKECIFSRTSGLNHLLDLESGFMTDIINFSEEV
ncbi:YagK/YfjJ domain-containing protein [Shewanella xiamenensis]|uniref:YagK/YfjJ domain-containing protein n=1 Tax=Shewanella xiamenensis TaxID=332186 RepID=UPI001F06275E|nr:inovirus-type Gp2 protein [Shewanella xiamenensis]UML94180.1 inovirus Gp2 family protein [Shewanella xiamenensis]